MQYTLESHECVNVDYSIHQEYTTDAFSPGHMYGFFLLSLNILWNSTGHILILLILLMSFIMLFALLRISTVDFLFCPADFCVEVLQDHIFLGWAAFLRMGKINGVIGGSTMPSTSLYS